MLRTFRREARAGRSLPFAITCDGDLAGQVTVSTVVRGAFDSAAVGYWVDERVAGQGVAPTALALVLDHCFREVGLHRVEADVRPENEASLRVVRKLGMQEEGLHRRFLFIDGAWRDHLCFALLREDASPGVLSRYVASVPDR
jgi:ribosomal-protein-alanine N-acetyltransferase